jgi:hypothetical protein
MKDDSEEFNEPYLPARYKEHVRAKKQRRLVRKILIASIVILAVIGLGLVVSGILPNLLLGVAGPHQNVTPAQTGKPAPAPTTVPPAASTTTNVTVTSTPAFTVGSGLSLLPSTGSLPLDKAVAALRQDYPEPEYEIISVNVTNRFAGRNLYEFSILPGAGTPGRVVTVAFIDAVTGGSYTPGQETARVSADRAQQIAASAFTSLGADQVRIRYTENSDMGKAWAFTLSKNSVTLITGYLDSETGQISSFERVLHPRERAVNPKIGMGVARVIADQYILDQNGGPQPVNMSEVRYNVLGSPGEPVAGIFTFEYNRIIQDIPCDNDGFTVSVDALTGEISGYSRRWSDPESAFGVVEEPLTLEHEATFKILQRAMDTYPGSINGLHIISVEIRWKDKHPPGTVPRPGSIQATWKVLFTDDILNAKKPPVTAVGWVDTQTGDILAFDYQH